MEKIENSEELKKNAEGTLACNDTNKYNEKVKKFYTCEEKLNISQELETIPPQLFCAKFNVELASLQGCMENSVIMYQGLKSNQLSSDSNHDTDSSSNYSESDLPERLISLEEQENILKDFKVLVREQFFQKYNSIKHFDKHLLYMLIVKKIQTKKIYKKNHIENPQMSQNPNLYDEFDWNVTNYSSLSISFPELNRGYTQRQLTQMKLEIEETEDLTKRLYDWCLQMQQKGIFVAEFMLRDEATRIVKKLCYSKVRVTNTWLNLWYDIYNINVHTINKSAEYFDRAFLYESTDIDGYSPQKDVQETHSRPMDRDWIERQEDIDNVGEDLYFWYDDIIKRGKLVSDSRLCARAKQVSIALNDRSFVPDILWLYEWKKQYNIQCVETEWKLFKLSKWNYKKRNNVTKNGRCSKIKRLKLCELSESPLSSSSSSIEPNVSKKTCQMDIWRPF